MPVPKVSVLERFDCKLTVCKYSLKEERNNYNVSKIFIKGQSKGYLDDHLEILHLLMARGGYFLVKG